jgi:hypothetical protein
MIFGADFIFYYCTINLLGNKYTIALSSWILNIQIVDIYHQPFCDPHLFPLFFFLIGNSQIQNQDKNKADDENQG